MARTSLISDELLRQLVAVGNVDILVGLPTFNHADTAASIVTTLHVGLARHFPRERTVLINADGGSDDGTVDVVRAAPKAAAELTGSASLRTTHRISASYAGSPGRAAGVRTVFAAADLLRARAVVLVDADVVSITPEWVAELAQPVWKDEADVVLPIHPRHRFEGPLLSQLVRPLLGAAYRRRLRSNFAGDFACSGAFAARMVTHGMWEHDLSRPALDVWVAATAMADELRLMQAHLGPRVLSPRAARSGLTELLEQVVGTAFECLGHHAARWTARTETTDVGVRGTPAPPAGEPSEPDVSRMAERYRTGVRDLAPLLRDILTPGTLARLQASAAPGEGVPRVPDPLWVAVVYEFAAASHRGIMSREHLTQALVPLYLGRTASFFAEIASADEQAHRLRLEALEREYEGLRPLLLERWNAEDRR